MYSKLNRIIVESSIVFVSIFATIGLLIGATTSEIKITYIYLGYMLYYSLPFILACIFSLVAILSEDENPEASEIASIVGTASFITGLAMLVLLASLAAQTALLPTSFTYIMPYPLVPYLEFLILCSLVLIIVVGTRKVIPKFKVLRNNKNSLFAVFTVLFIAGIVIMSMFGVRRVEYTAKKGALFLHGSPNYPFESVEVTLQMTDQVVVKLNSSENKFFSYVFTDAVNHRLYLNDSTRLDAKPIKYGNYKLSASFSVVAENSSVYYLMIKSEYTMGSNVTYSIDILKLDNSVLVITFFVSTFFLSVVVAIATSIEDERSYIV